MRGRAAAPLHKSRTFHMSYSDWLRHIHWVWHIQSLVLHFGNTGGEVSVN